MTLPMPSWVITALLDEDPLTLNRAVGIVRRHNLPVTSVSFAPTMKTGVSRLTTIVSADTASVIRMTNALRKMAGVVEACVEAEADCLVREHAVIRVRPPARELARLFDVAALYQVSVLDDRVTELVLEVSTSPPSLISLLRALEPFNVIDVARSGAVVLSPVTDSDSAGRAAAPVPRVAAAIPA